MIAEELAESCYIKVTESLPPISALGAVPKPSWGIRLIHDCSQPERRSLNDYSTKIDVRYQTLQAATRLLRRDYYIAKVDLKSAYRSVGLHPSQYPFTGLKRTFCGETELTYLCDTRLCFGARKSPGIFHRLTQAIQCMMRHRGYTNVVYLDDFLVIGRTQEECTDAHTALFKLLRMIGFSIAWDKVEGPTQGQMNAKDVPLEWVSFSALLVCQWVLILAVLVCQWVLTLPKWYTNLYFQHSISFFNLFCVICTQGYAPM